MDYFFGFLVSFIVNFSLSVFIYKRILRHKTRPHVMHSDKWILVKDQLLPDDIGEFFASDGQRVFWVYNAHYNKYGQPMSGSKMITHWLPKPLPPKQSQ